jgi:hypothetical protein
MILASFIETGKKQFTLLIRFAIQLITVCFFSVHAGRAVENTINHNFNNYSHTSISEFEHHFKQSVSDKNKHASQVQGKTEIFSQSDLFYLTKVWRFLSDATKNEYLSLSIIPDSAKVFTTPGNHFEIYYLPSHAASHLNGDNYSFDRNSWRIKQFAPNGIPDYVDEIGWALDSCWELEVNKFNFITPIPYKDKVFPSDKYKVMADNITGYGFTYPFPVSDTTLYPKGWSSIIEISTNWTEVNYYDNPLDAIRVTCAHEFFHAIQFSMTWNVNDNFNLTLDDYPLAWLEGTATSLEEIAFPYVNDYVHYSSYYYTVPNRPFLHDKDIPETFVYTNSLLMLYISKILSPLSIEFIRNVLFNNYNKLYPFYSNIRTVSKKFNKNWTDILHDFHVASFYSGKYADSSRFLSDARMFDTILVHEDSIDSFQPIVKKVYPYAMSLFSMRNTNSFLIDSMRLTFNHISQNTASAADIPWKASILRVRTSIDTPIPVSLDNNGDGAYTIRAISPNEKIVAIVTNGHALESKEYGVLFNDCPDNSYSSDTIRFSAVATDSQSSATALFKLDTTILPCTPSLSIAAGKIYSEKATSMSLILKSVPFDFSYPFFWQNKSGCALSISTKNVLDADYAVYKWDDLKQLWEKISGFTNRVSDGISTFTINTPVSGIYAIGAIVDNDKISVYPNPVSLRNGSIFLSGKSIKTVTIYDATGQVVVYVPHVVSIPYQWQLITKFNKHVVPGIYYAVIGYETSLNKRYTYKQKIMVTP